MRWELRKNGLGVNCASTLWYFHERGDYIPGDGSSCNLGRRFGAEEQAANSARLEAMLAENELAGKVQMGTLLWKNQKLELYNSLLTCFGLAADAHSAEAQRVLMTRMMEFLRAGKQRIPDIADRDLYRASTNAWPMFTLQYLGGQPSMPITEVVLAFSLLYPFTDDVYDDENLTADHRMEFGQRLARRLAGDFSTNSAPKGAREARIWAQVDAIERHIDRSRYQQPWEAMVGLNNAQIASMGQVDSQSEEDVWNMTVWKGAGSILADCALVMLDVTPEMASFASHFGAITQFLNDIKSIPEDHAARQWTPYAWTCYKPVEARSFESVDALQDAVFRYVLDVFNCERHRAVFTGLEYFLDSMRQFLLLKFLEGLAMEENSGFFSQQYLETCEQFSPVKFATLRKLRSKLNTF